MPSLRNVAGRSMSKLQQSVRLVKEIIKRIFVFDAESALTWYDQVTFDSPADLRTFLHRPVKPPLSDLPISCPANLERKVD